jgi:hypothetical protein
MSLAILGLFKALSPLFPTGTRRFAPAGGMGRLGHAVHGVGQPLQHVMAPIRPTTPRAAALPLRVTRVLDQGCPGTSAGRMVMSGSFADVCAELDRLVALESAREATRTRH